MQSDLKATTELSDARRALLQRYLRGGLTDTRSSVTIPKRPTTEPIPLSYSQQQIWVHSQLAGETAIYNEPITIQFSGPLDVTALERSFNEIVRRHEAWRTIFSWEGDHGIQKVQPPPEQITIPRVDLRSTLQDERDQEALRLAKRDILQPFDLAHGAMYRLQLVQMSDSEHRLYLTLHHIIFDGFSLYRVLLPELQTLYRAFANRRSALLPDLAIQYPDYANWQRSTIKGISPEQLSYWKTVCDELPVIDLPTHRSRPAVQTYSGATEFLQISSATTSALKALSDAQGTTPFMTMVAAFMTLLHSYTGQEDIVVGGVSNGRQHTETMGLLGCFLNTVPIRCAFSKDLPFTDLLSRIRKATLDALSHEVPFELLVQRFAQGRDPSRAPLIQVLIVVEPPLDGLQREWGFSYMDVDTGVAKFDLELGLDDRPEGLTGRFIYNTDLFQKETIALLKSRWLRLLDRIATNPQQRLSDLTRTLLPNHTPAVELPRDEWNATTTDYPRDATIHELFEEQAKAHPSAIAITFGREQLTYDQLNRRANRLAHRLRKLEVSRDLPVGVCLDRSLETVVALLAILKAGGAYVPLDPEYPTERLAFMIEDTAAAAIITTSRVANSNLGLKQSRKSDRPLLCIDTENFDDEDDRDPQKRSVPEDLAYIMYTSGSTGRPKGVAIPHRAVVRLVRGTNCATFSSDETFLQLAPISFDASTFEIWGALLNGGRLVIMPPARPSLEEIGSAIGQHGVTTLWLTAGLFNAMVDERLQDLRPLRQLLTGGDVLSVAHVGKALAGLKQTRVINGYGPTESTTFACCHPIAPTESLGNAIPIGRPIANTTAYILDSNLQPVPIGEGGELYLGGDGLARGYWRNDQLTAEKFVANPFSHEPEARLYRTGDIARWRSDGVIEFIGRVDHQIKLRGFRIEPGEIEAALKEQPGVRDSIVVVHRETSSGKRLIAYVVSDLHGQEASLLSALKKSLPDYMMPAAIVTLPALPRTPNGKVDRNALPIPSRSPTKPNQDFVTPKTPLEERLAAIWADVLATERVGANDNFFDLGGHSLSGLRLVNRLREMLGKHIPLAIVFEAPTVAEMANHLEQNYNVAGNHAASEESGTFAPVVPINRESRRARRP